jgi:hypothetical protein
MIKTTNYEISKKLAEIGFEAKANHGWHKDNLESGPAEFLSNYAFCTNYIKAFDLETLLDALPNFIENGNRTENCLVVDVAFGEIHYEGDCENDALFITKTRENESLADTAGRLIIELYNNNLIEF